MIGGVFGKFNLLASLILNPLLDASYYYAISTLKTLGVKVFVFFLDPSTAARLLEQGHQLGLFGQNTIVFVNSDVAQGNPAQYLSPGVDPTEVFGGVFSLQYDPTFVLRNTPSLAAEFIGGLHLFGATKIPSGGSLVCNSATDNEGNSLFINATGGCEPFSFLSLTADNVSPKAIAAFDGVLMYATGANFTKDTFTHTALGRIALHDALISTDVEVVTFGASGVLALNVNHC